MNNRKLFILVVLIIIFCIISSYSISNYLKKIMTYSESYDNAPTTSTDPNITTNPNTDYASILASTSTSSQNYDNYDHYSQTSSPTIYYGNNGFIAKMMDDNGTFFIFITSLSGETSSYVYKDPSYNGSSSYSSNSSILDSLIGKKFFGYYDKNNSGNLGGFAQFGKTGNEYNITLIIGSTTIFFTPKKPYYDTSTTSSNPPYIDTTSDTLSTQGQSPSSNDYYSTLPVGIPSSSIPSNNQDQYILKSQIIPMGPFNQTCPTCGGGSNNGSNSSRGDKCPPCPACARCPEPSITCKAVPNYDSSLNSDYNNQIMMDNPSVNSGTIPYPVLNNFSSFGM